MRVRDCVVAAALSTLLGTAALASPTPGQIDTFQDGTTEGWQTGRSGSPINVATGGPGGAGDAFLQMFTSGFSGGPGSKAIIFNHGQWTGNYASAGVTQIEMDLKDLGNTPLHMRIALNQGSGGPGYESTNAFDLSPDGAWHHAVFQIDAADLTALESPSALATVLSNVAEVRILSAASPSLDGDAIAATVGIDNINAVPEPTGGLLALIAAPLFLRRKRG